MQQEGLLDVKTESECRENAASMPYVTPDGTLCNTRTATHANDYCADRQHLLCTLCTDMNHGSSLPPAYGERLGCSWPHASSGSVNANDAAYLIRCTGERVQVHLPVVVIAHFAPA